MAAVFAVVVNAGCPLCGVPILSVGRGGRVTASDLHPVMTRRGEGYMLCEGCGFLADLPHRFTLN